MVKCLHNFCIRLFPPSLKTCSSPCPGCCRDLLAAPILWRLRMEVRPLIRRLRRRGRSRRAHSLRSGGLRQQRGHLQHRVQVTAAPMSPFEPHARVCACRRTRCAARESAVSVRGPRPCAPASAPPLPRLGAAAASLCRGGNQRRARGSACELRLRGPQAAAARVAGRTQPRPSRTQPRPSRASFPRRP